MSEMDLIKILADIGFDLNDLLEELGFCENLEDVKDAIKSLKKIVKKVNG